MPKHGLFVLLLLPFSAFGQLVTEANGRFGLVDRDGSVILENVYDRIAEADGGAKVFIYEKNGFSGIAIPSSNILLPCDAQVTQVATNLFIECSPIGCRIVSGQKSSSGEWRFTVSDDQYDEAWRLNDEHIGVRRGELYGALSNTYPPVRSEVPLRFTEPIRWGYPYGYYSYNAQGHVVVYTDDGSGLHSIACTTRSSEPGYDTRFVWWYTPERDSLVVLDAHTGKSLGAYHRAPKEGKAVVYNERWRCITTRTPVGKSQQRIALINPLTGEELCSETVTENTAFQLSSDPLDRDVDSTVTVVLCRFGMRSNIYTHVGELTGYHFKPAVERTVSKERFTGGGKTVPFFMPGDR